MTVRPLLLALVLAPALASPAWASEGGGLHGPTLLGVRVEFLLFALTLLGVALFHKHTLPVALTGLAAIGGWSFGVVGKDPVAHLLHEGVGLLNLLGLLLGFALLAKHFEESKIPDKLPAWLPDDWKGGYALLVLVAVLSSFLDNIAAAMIGGTMARVLYKGKVHIGFLAAIVAASNAGGAGSVVGDTTTTMMWIDPVRQVSPLEVAEAALGAAIAVLFSGFFAARQQHAHQPIQKDAQEGVTIDLARVGIVALILAGAVAANIWKGLPAVGVWVAIAAGALVRHTAWGELPAALKGSAFLLSLVLCASLMPVHELPPPTWPTALGLGFVSAVFDNIPLTKLALTQGGYDWGFLAFAVGYGGSMIWFGSSAGVALSTQYPDARSVGAWVRNGWHVAVAYVLGFLAMLAVFGWHVSGGAPVDAGAAVVQSATPGAVETATPR
jgi:Na+/H+ antiporter NhaD/arsenite permease-like protein